MAFRTERNATEGVPYSIWPVEVLPWFEPCRETAIYGPEGKPCPPARYIAGRGVKKLY